MWAPSESPTRDVLSLRTLEHVDPEAPGAVQVVLNQGGRVPLGGPRKARRAGFGPLRRTLHTL